MSPNENSQMEMEQDPPGADRIWAQTQDWRREAGAASEQNEVFWRAQRLTIQSRLATEGRQQRTFNVSVLRTVAATGLLGCVVTVGWLGTGPAMDSVNRIDPTLDRPVAELSVDDLGALFSDIDRVLEQPGARALDPAVPVLKALDDHLVHASSDEPWSTRVTVNLEENL